MKKYARVAAWVATLACLCGCSVAQNNETTVPTESTVTTTQETLPPETTAPPVTTAPPEIIPAYPVLQAEAVSATETLASFDPSVSGNQIILRGENGIFDASYVRLGTRPSIELYPYNNGCFWFVVGQEKKSGNKYDIFAPEEDRLRKLEDTGFREEYIVDGQRIPLELRYLLLGEQVLSTYQPVGTDGSYAQIVDCSQGVHRCLVQFFVHDPNTRQNCSAFRFVDLETGQLTDFLTGFEPDTYGDIERVLYLKEDGSFFGQTKENALRCYDVSAGTVTEYALSEAHKDALFQSVTKTPAGLICRYTVDNHDILYEIRFTDGALIPILTDSGTKVEHISPLGYVLYRDADGKWCLHDTAAGEAVVLVTMSRLVYADTVIVYQDSEGCFHIYDATDKEDLIIEKPEQWEKIDGWTCSSDGRKVLAYSRSNTGLFQLVLVDLESNRQIHWQREVDSSAGPGYEYGIFWDGDNAISIASVYVEEGQPYLRDFCIYRFVTE